MSIDWYMHSINTETDFSYRNWHASAVKAERKQSALALQTLVTDRKLGLGYCKGVAQMKHA
jgi:hypothetical protein